MRLLPYSKQLIARRAAGELPWLVIVTLGNGVEQKLLRMMAFGNDAGVARIWVPDDFNLAQADLSWVVGMDVLVAYLGDRAARATELALGIWKARPATLWFLMGTPVMEPGRQWGYDESKPLAGRAQLSHSKYGEPFEFGHPSLVPLDAEFRSKVKGARDLALIVQDAPLFDAPAFAKARAHRLRELGVAA